MNEPVERAARGLLVTRLATQTTTARLNDDGNKKSFVYAHVAKKLESRDRERAKTNYKPLSQQESKT